MSTDMVQRCFNNVWQHTQLAQHCCGSATQIVDCPLGNADALVEDLLGPIPSLKAFVAKHEVGQITSRQPLDNCHRLQRQRNNVLATVLTTRWRQHDLLVDEVNLL